METCFFSILSNFCWDLRRFYGRVSMLKLGPFNGYKLHMSQWGVGEMFCIYYSSNGQTWMKQILRMEWNEISLKHLRSPPEKGFSRLPHFVKRSSQSFDHRRHNLDARILHSWTYLFVCKKMKNALPFGIAFLLFFTLTSDKRRGRALTGSIFSFISSSSSSSSGWQHLNSRGLNMSVGSGFVS